MVQTALQENPFSGHVFVFRGRRGDLIKVLWFDGDGLCLFAKRLNPVNPRRMSVTPATIQIRVPAASPIIGANAPAQCAVLLHPHCL